MRSFIVHAAYWLSHRYGRRFAVRFDSEPDLNYLGVCVDDIARNLSVLEQSGMLISDQPGRGRSEKESKKSFKRLSEG